MRGFGIWLITHKGDFGFGIHKNHVCIRNGNSQKFHYLKNPFVKRKVR
jgi:hypothetical protein